MAQATLSDKHKLSRPVARQNAATTKKLFISNGRQNVADINPTKQIKRFVATGQNTATETYRLFGGQRRLTK